MIQNFRPPSFVQYDGLISGGIGDVALADMFTYSESEIEHEESSQFYRLLLSSQGGGGSSILAQCDGREMLVAADDRSMVVARAPREMTA
jgi:hypothetical protein